MKRIKYITFLFLLIGLQAFAQKREIRQAEDAIEKQDFSGAKALLDKAKPDISSLNDKFLARFYTAYGTAVGMTSDGKLEAIEEAAESFEKAIQYGNESEGKQGLHLIGEFLVNSAIQDQEQQNFEPAYKKLYKAYEINPTDTIYLFAAAGNAYNAGNDDKAIEYYSKLRDMKFKGNAIRYTAVHKETGEKQYFDNKGDRELFLKSGEYTDPQEERTERRDGDVIKQLALTYLRKGDQEKAITTIKEARKVNPNDMELIKAEAMIYEQTGESEKYLDLVQDLIREDPDNAAAYYVILGDHALRSGDEDKAKGFYEKAIDEDPSSVTAYNGIANSYLTRQEEIVKEMNSLGMSREDTKKYNKLSEERNDLLKAALPYLEKAFENAPESVELMQTLYQINSQLRNTEEAQKYKKMMENAGN